MIRKTLAGAVALGFLLGSAGCNDNKPAEPPKTEIPIIKDGPKGAGGGGGGGGGGKKAGGGAPAGTAN
jgi:hypothetical protein